MRYINNVLEIGCKRESIIFVRARPALIIRVAIMNARANQPEAEPFRANRSGAIPVKKIKKIAHSDPKGDPKA